MTVASKVFVVIIAALSLAYLGFAAVTVVGGPNYQVEHVEQLPDYVFELSPGEQSIWAVKTRRKQEAVPVQGGTLPAAILAARKHLDQTQSARIAALDQELPVLTTRIADARKAIEMDLQVLKQRESELQAELDALRQQIDNVTQQVIARTQEAQSIRDEAKRRREDVLRLTNQLAEVRTDYFRVVEQIKKIENALVQVEGRIARADARNRQLKQAGAELTRGDAKKQYEGESVEPGQSGAP